MIKLNALTKSRLSSFSFQDEPARFLNKAKGSMGMSPTLKGDLELTCEVSPASAAVVWKKDQVPLIEDQRISFVSKVTQRKLIIKNAKKSDEGQYSCETAADKVTFQVKIKGKIVRRFCWLYKNVSHFLCSSLLKLPSFHRNSSPSYFLQQRVSPAGSQSCHLPEGHSELRCVR